MSVELPFNEDFQSSIVAMLWRSSGALQKYREHIALGYLSSAENTSVIGFLYRHFDAYKKSPTYEVLLDYVYSAYPDWASDPLHAKSVANLKAKIEKLKEIDLSDRKYLEDRLKEFIQFEAIKNFVTGAIQGLKTRDYDPDLARKAREALEAGALLDQDTGHDWVRQTRTRIINGTNPDHEPRISTGIIHLDNLIGGGLKAGELGILLGLPKGFKSGTLMNFAHSAMKRTNGQNVVYVTLELSEELVGMRFDLRTAMQTKAKMFEDPERFIKILQTRQDALIGNNRLWIKYFKTKTATVETIKDYCERIQDLMGQKIGMLVVDYMDLLKPSRKREKSYQEDVDIAEDLRDLGHEFRMPVWTACRATREAVGKKRISMAHMSRAFERVGVADLMIALCQTEREKAQQIMRLYLAATRNDAGEKMVKCKLDYERMYIKSEEVVDPEYDDAPDGGDEDGGPRRGRGQRRERHAERDWDAVPAPQQRAA